MEEAIASAGAAPVLLGLLVLPLLWGLPQALMTAELSAMFDELNGGYIVWVREAFPKHPFAGFYNGWLCIVVNVVDLALYPALISAYIAQLTPEGALSGAVTWAIRLASVAAVFVTNAAGLKHVGLATLPLFLLIFMPFVTEFAIVVHGQESSARMWETWARGVDEPDWAGYMSTMLWLYSGWDSLGCIAAEARGELEEEAVETAATRKVPEGGAPRWSWCGWRVAPKRRDSRVQTTYPRAILIALLLITVVQLAAVAAGVLLDGDFDAWDDGHLAQGAARLGSGMRSIVVLGGAASSLGQLAVIMATSSRALWSLADGGHAPRALAYSSPRTGVPLGALGAQCVVVCCLVTLDFRALVTLDTFFNSITVLIECAAFLWLKWDAPEATRPFAVPGGWFGAIAATLPKFVLIGICLITEPAGVWLAGAGATAAIYAAYALLVRSRARSASRSALGSADPLLPRDGAASA